jgi:hypothetical protein
MKELESVAPCEEQPELLDPNMYPRRLEVEALAKDSSCLPKNPAIFLQSRMNRRTGKILLARLKSEPEFAEAVCSALALGMSARLVAIRFGISPESVDVVRRAMTERGELSAVRLRIQRKIDRLAEDGLDEIWRGLMAGRIHPGQAWIPTLATIDKRGQLEAGIVPGTDRPVEAVTLERLMAAREIVRAALEYQSSAVLAQSVDNQCSVPQYVEAATAVATVPAAVVVPVEPAVSPT